VKLDACASRELLEALSGGFYVGNRFEIISRRGRCAECCCLGVLEVCLFDAVTIFMDSDTLRPKVAGPALIYPPALLLMRATARARRLLFPPPP
jgi:hypothetical protein